MGEGERMSKTIRCKCSPGPEPYLATVASGERSNFDVSGNTFCLGEATHFSKLCRV